jgi:hypothetical protein
MKTRAISLLVIFLVLCSIIISKEQRQKTGWKGKIEIEDGVKVIKNQEEPFTPSIIRKGYIYRSEGDPDTDFIKVKRYKI